MRANNPPSSLRARQLHSKRRLRRKIGIDLVPCVIEINGPVVHLVPHGRLAGIAWAVYTPVDVVPVFGDVALSDRKIDTVREISWEVVIAPTWIHVRQCFKIQPGITYYMRYSSG